MLNIQRLTSVFALFVVLGCIVLASEAEAAMIFCNKTSGAIEAALGRRDGEVWSAEGWWMLEPGQCSKVLAGPLADRFYFYFATALTKPAQDQDPKVWGGKYQFCTANEAFKIEGDSDCEAKNQVTRGFQEVDIGANIKDYTLDFKDGR